MATIVSRIARVTLMLVLAGSVAGCGLPRVGPNKNEIYSGSVLRQGDAFVVDVNSRVTRATAVYPALGFSNRFSNTGVIGADTIRPGDTLTITVFENVDNGLFVGGGQPRSSLNQLQVDGDGFIFIPYVGRIRAAGNTPEALRRIVTEQLGGQTPDPQVIIQRAAGNGSTVTLLGGVGSQGVFPIQRPTRTLSAMLAAAGGVSVPPEIAQVTVIRGGVRETAWFEDLYVRPEFDIPLRNGDRILVEPDDRTYTSLGAGGRQALVPFDRRSISAVEAIAQIGGLSGNQADPTGVFILRNEDEVIARQVLGRTDLRGPQRMVYVLNLTEPNGLFEARDFAIRNGDTIYLTEAPFSQFTKVISAILGTAGRAEQVATLTE